MDPGREGVIRACRDGASMDDAGETAHPRPRDEPDDDPGTIKSAGPDGIGTAHGSTLMGDMMYRNRIATGLGALVGLLFAAAAFANYDINLPPPKNAISRDVFNLHMWTMYVCFGIFIVVFGTMFWSIFNHRKSKGAKAAHFHENTAIEIIWTIIPFVILVFLAIPATRTVLAMKDTSNPDMTVKVTAYQWKWEYDYQQEGFKFFSTLSTPREQIGEPGVEGTAKGPNYLLEVDNPLVIPAGKKVRFLVTANDVIHGFYIPQVSVHQYGIPGFVKDTWVRIDEPGTYRGQCSQICGKEHGFMPIVIIAKTPEDYAAWAKEQKAKATAEAAPAVPAQAAAPAPAAPATDPAAADAKPKS